MFSNSLLFLLIIFIGHCYAKFLFPFPSHSNSNSNDILSAKPPNCPSYTNEQNCLNYRVLSDPRDSWCVWAGGHIGCFWKIAIIGHFYCPSQTLCVSPFCKSAQQEGIDACVATDMRCFRQTTQQGCESVSPICRWYRPGETPDNPTPNFGVCGNRLNLKWWPFG